MIAQLKREGFDVRRSTDADGSLIEVHPDLDLALSADTQLKFLNQFDQLRGKLRISTPAIGRSICPEIVEQREVLE